jgi:hypothetical protein
MAYADSLLAEGEHVVYRTRQHPLGRLFASTWGIVLAGIGLALLVVLAFFGIGSGLIRDLLGWATVICLLVGGALIGWNYVAWYQEDYLITSRRVMKVGGILNKKSMDSSLEKINDAILEQSLFGRIFDWGNLRILTAAEEIADDFHMLHHAPEFKKVMVTTKNDLEEGGDIRRTRYVDAPAPAPPPAPAPQPVPVPVPVAPPPAPRPSAEEKLRSLAKLRDDGLITPEDYEAKKGDLLKEL